MNTPSMIGINQDRYIDNIDIGLLIFDMAKR